MRERRLLLVATSVCVGALVWLTFGTRDPGMEARVAQPAGELSPSGYRAPHPSAAVDAVAENMPGSAAASESRATATDAGSLNPVGGASDAEDEFWEVTDADSFNALMNLAVDSGNAEALDKALSAHDVCAGLPRDEQAYQDWLVRHASDADFDVRYAQQLYARCADLPILPFQRRIDIIQPLADKGDAHAQHLLGSSYPAGSASRHRWLRKAIGSGSASAAALLALDTLASELPDDRDVSWRLLRFAVDRGVAYSKYDIEELEAAMTDEEITAARDRFEARGVADIVDSDWAAAQFSGGSM